MELSSGLTIQINQQNSKYSDCLFMAANFGRMANGQVKAISQACPLPVTSFSHQQLVSG
ncbi:MAG TPA: hypothetical protein PKM63_01450 [Panacibacter sp.]|nr:hypothetical protein [Panacibacter sp.]HNP42920.1 hypothetical protein [Panacibacter sp.]